MDLIEKALNEWKELLCPTVDVGGLFSRNATAHKWKATFRSLMIRESIAWRTQDLLMQSLFLYKAHQLLGARILLRSALESIAVLIYLNQQTRKVLAGELNFHDYSDKTAILLLGSRDKSTNHQALNIVTILQKCNARYPQIEDLYAILSESAHPNYEGVCVGYSDADKENHVTSFSNKWSSMYGKSHISSIELCMTIFDVEYNNEWGDSFELLESWIVSHDIELEKTKRKNSN